MFEVFNLWPASAWMPHGYCLQWDPWLVGLHVVSDGLIALSYYSIPLLLLIVLRRKWGFPFSGLTALFAVFIFSCGTTHLMEIWTLWEADYVTEGVIKAVTAVASLTAVIVLTPSLSKIMALRNPLELEAANAVLQAEIEERRRADLELELRTRELARSEEALRDFAYAASHTLREPIERIQYEAQRLEPKVAEAIPDAAAQVQAMCANADRLGQLLVALLEYMRVDARSQPPLRFDLDRVLDEALGDQELQIERTAAKVERTPLPEIEGDPLQFRQLFIHLISNALKFGKPNEPPHIRIETQPAPAEGWARVAVIDYGIGFDSRQAQRLFELFFRGYEHSELPGAGMGLPIARKIIERHGGRIRAEGAPGQYAKFTFTVPVQQPRTGIETLELLRTMSLEAESVAEEIV